MSALHSTCCDASVRSDLFFVDGVHRAFLVCNACGSRCSAKLNTSAEQRDARCSPHQCGELRDLLIEAADQIDEQIDVFVRSNRSWTYPPGPAKPVFSPSNQREFDRLTDLARRLREAAG